MTKHFYSAFKKSKLQLEEFKNRAKVQHIQLNILSKNKKDSANKILNVNAEFVANVLQFFLDVAPL